MRRIAVFPGSVVAETGGAWLPAPDRAAVALAVGRLGGRVDAYAVRDDGPALAYARAAGAVSATVVAELGDVAFDVALVGPAGAGAWGDLLPAALAERHDAALVLDVLDLTAGPEGLLITRDLGRGAREELRVAGRVVLAVSPEAAPIAYVSQHRVWRQREPCGTATAPLPTDPLDEVAGPWEPLSPRARPGRLGVRAAGSAAERIDALLGTGAAAREESRAHVVVADGRTCAGILLRYLGHLGVLDRGRAPLADPSSDEGPRAPGDASVRSVASSPPSGRTRRAPRPIDPA